MYTWSAVHHKFEIHETELKNTNLTHKSHSHNEIIMVRSTLLGRRKLVALLDRAWEMNAWGKSSKYHECLFDIGSPQFTSFNWILSRFLTIIWCRSLSLTTPYPLSLIKHARSWQMCYTFETTAHHSLCHVHFTKNHLISYSNRICSTSPADDYREHLCTEATIAKSGKVCKSIYSRKCVINVRKSYLVFKSLP